MNHSWERIRCMTLAVSIALFSVLGMVGSAAADAHITYNVWQVELRDGFARCYGVFANDGDAGATVRSVDVLLNVRAAKGYDLLNTHGQKKELSTWVEPGAIVPLDFDIRDASSHKFTLPTMYHYVADVSWD